MSIKIEKQQILKTIRKNLNGTTLTPRETNILISNDYAYLDKGKITFFKKYIREATEKAVNAPYYLFISDKLYELSQSELRSNFSIDVLNYDEEDLVCLNLSTKEVFSFMYNYQSSFNELIHKHWNLELDVRADENPSIKEKVRDLLNEKCATKFNINKSTISYLINIVEHIGLSKTKMDTKIQTEDFYHIIEDLKRFETNQIYSTQILYVKNMPELDQNKNEEKHCNR